MVKVIASDGKSGETKEISYSNCKVIGNGSFGVVFQAKLVGPPNEGDDIAIKKVLQDKRFKVCADRPLYHSAAIFCSRAKCDSDFSCPGVLES